MAKLRRIGWLIALLARLPRGGVADGSLQHPYPLWPSEPVPGWPGLNAGETTTREKLSQKDGAGNVVLPAQYGQPEFLAYPGAVHHIRNEWQRYVPSYPIYSHHTLVRNFVLEGMPAYRDACVAFAEPVYYNPMYGKRIPTSQRRTAVRAFSWKRGGEPIRLELGRLKPGLYCLRPIYAAPGVRDPSKKKYVTIRFRVNDAPDDPERMTTCFLRAQTLDNFYAGQEFFFHAADDRVFRAELALMPESETDLLVHNVDLHDRFGQCARRKGKTRSVLFDASERKRRWDTAKTDPAFRAKELVSAEEQRRRDDAVWRGGLPLNVHVMFGGVPKHRFMMCRAPEAWAGRPSTVRCKDGRFYAGNTPGRWSWHVYNEPAKYTFRGGTVGCRYRDKKGRWQTGEVCPYAPNVRLDTGTKRILRGDQVLRQNVDRAWVRGASVLEDGRVTGPAEGDINLATFGPKKRYFDKAGRHAQEVVFELGGWAKGQLFYNASAVRDLPHGRGLDRPPKGTESVTQFERDWAMRFIRDVYRWPALQPKHNLTYMLGGAVTGAPHRPHGLDREWNRRYGWGVRSQYLLEGYDQVFPAIDGNVELARAVGRYIPWVKTPDDLIRLIDTHLVQDNANDIMHFRYYYDHGMHLLMIKAVVVQDDAEITRPWMEFLWTRMWEYPQALSGMADNIVTGATRDGGTTIGSFNYTRSPRHMELMERIEQYLRAGGDRKYDVADPDRYRQVHLSPYFVLEAAAAGRHAPGIGDVGGATQAYGGRLEAGTRDLCAVGWRWHRDPRFAYELVHTYGRAKDGEQEWRKIEAAAKGVRDPYLQNRSRVLSDWSGYLEGGQEEDDFRFRRAVAVRVGNGRGHNHWDTLDLRLWAHGIVMSGDAGQRSAYGRPNHRRSRVHNVMEVDGRDWYAYSWIATLFDAPGAHYLRAESIAPYGMEHVRVFQRQVALLDVDPGRHSKADVPRKDPSVVTPSSYVLDVFRGSGGRTYTYCFHGAVDDQFEVNIKNRRDMAGKGDDPDEAYLREFEYRSAVQNPSPGDVEWAADPDGAVLQATWRVARWEDHRGNPEAKMYSGKHGGAMTRPRKYTRLHLFDASDCRVLHGICQDRVRWNEHNVGKPKYGVRCLFAQRRHQQPSDTVFVALIEPYAGNPFITERRLLAIEGNDSDALRAVAIEVRTANGHTDLLFADGRPGRHRSVEGGVRIVGEYAYLSRDRGGVRHATIHNGTLLRTPDIAIEVKETAYGGLVTGVDYLKRRVTVAGRVPKYLEGHFFEAGGDRHRTSCEVQTIEPGDRSSVLTLRKGMEIMRTRVRSVDVQTATVVGTIAMIRARGRDRGLVASNDALTRLWRVAYRGGNRHTGHVFRLSPLDPNAKGPAFTEADFPPGSGLSVWEFGGGDRMLIRTGVSLQRRDDGLYRAYATSPFRLTVRGKRLEASVDGKAWRPLSASGEISEGLLSAGRCRLLLRPVP